MREALVSLDDAEFETLGIGELVSLFQAAGIQELAELACHGDSSVVRAETDERVDEDRLDGLEYVEEWERVSETDESTLYVVAFSVPEVSESLSAEIRNLVGTCDPEIDENGTTMSLVGPQEAISGTIGEYEAEGVSLHLEKLGEYRGPDQPMDELTDRQREVIETAYDMGYYEVPRGVSTSDVAAELDLDPSTVAEHLQRAERNLLTYHLSSV